MKLTREVKRYDLGIAKSPLTGQAILTHVEYEDGAWVKYVDIADLLQAKTDSVHLAKPLAESAVAPGECGSVPDGWKLVPIEPTQEMIQRACKDHGYPGGSRFIYVRGYRSMLAAAPALGMQPPNNQPNSDHVAVTSAEPESSLTDGIDLFALFEAGWSFHQSLQGHVLDGRDVGRLTGCEFWPAILQRMHIGTDLHVGLSVDEAIVRLKQEIKRRLTVAQQWQKHDQCLAAQSGISSLDRRPNEKESLYPCGYHQCEGCNICSGGQEGKQ